MPGPSTTKESSSCLEVNGPDLDAAVDNEEEEEEHDKSPANEGKLGKYIAVLEC